LITQRLVPRNNAPYRDIFIANTIIGKDSIRNNAYMFPLYLYPDADHPLPGETRAPNLDAAIVAEISTRVGLRFTAEKANNSKTFAPIDILDYIYAVLHSPRYREKYKAFLKIDFPRVPCPADAGQFRRLAKLGEKLRRLHLLESVEPKDGMADFPITGNGEIDKIIYAAPAPKKSPPVEGTAGGRVYINSKQYFDNVPPEAWEFHIGGYRPARKWLKDRNGLKLEYDDVRHYRKIIRVLTETAKIMEEIIL
jgi:predicted helicase